MRNKFIKISYLLACAAFACSDSHAMENENPNIVSSRKVEEKTPDSCSTAQKEQWKILEKEGSGEYARLGATYGGRYSKEMRLFPPEKSQSFFIMIFIGKVASLEIDGQTVDVKDMYYLHILPHPWGFLTGEKKEFVIELVKEFESKGISYIQEGKFQEGNGIYSCYHKKCYTADQAGELLSVFYNRNLIPEYVIDRMTEYTGMKDFRRGLGAYLRERSDVAIVPMARSHLNPVDCFVVYTPRNDIKRINTFHPPQD